MAALFLLNVYYKGETFHLGSDSSGATFPVALESTLFSVNLHPYTRTGGTDMKLFAKNAEFDRCVYYINCTDDTRTNLLKAIQGLDEGLKDRLRNHPKLAGRADMEEIVSNVILARREIGDKEFVRLAAAASAASSPLRVSREYEGLLNCNPTF